MRNFRELEIWKKGMKLCNNIYDLCERLPESERFGLKSQITRCAVSVPSNIAEGASRSSELDFMRFLEIALGSCYELETQVLIVQERFLKGQEQNEIMELLWSEQKMITAFHQKIKTTVTKKAIS